jgi:hypothetical protein
MSLSDRIEEISKKSSKVPSPYCVYQSLYNRLPAADQKAIDEAVAKDFPMSLLVQAIRAEGYKTSSDAVRLHFKGQCKCQKN